MNDLDTFGRYCGTNPIPVTQIKVGNLVDTRNAEHPGPVVRVAEVHTYAGKTYVFARESGDLVPTIYTFHTWQFADLHDPAAR